MRPIIGDMKEKLTDNSIDSFNWISTKKMVADILTKEKSNDKELEDIIKKNEFEVTEEEALLDTGSSASCIGLEKCSIFSIIRFFS